MKTERDQDTAIHSLRAHTHSHTINDYKVYIFYEEIAPSVPFSVFAKLFQVVQCHVLLLLLIISETVQGKAISYDIERPWCSFHPKYMASFAGHTYIIYFVSSIRNLFESIVLIRVASIHHK